MPAGPMLQKMEAGIRALNIDAPLLVGIHSGGAWIARRLHDALGIESRLGLLDISFYRDDFSRVGLNPKVKTSDLPEAVDDRAVILIDDVLHTGRTIRAALNEIFSWGRPASVRLAVALERPGRELPIAADVCGETVTLAPNQQAKLVQRDDNLVFDIINTDARA